MVRPETLNYMKIDYITKGYSFKQLSRIYEVNLATLSKYNKRDNWKEQRLKYIADTEIKLKQELSLAQAKEDLYDRIERAKEFKRIVKQDIDKLLNDTSIKTKSHESLLSATVDASKHIELLEGNLNEGGSQINIINYKLKFDATGKPIIDDELKDKLENRSKSLA